MVVYMQMWWEIYKLCDCTTMPPEYILVSHAKYEYLEHNITETRTNVTLYCVSVLQE